MDKNKNNDVSITSLFPDVAQGIESCYNNGTSITGLRSGFSKLDWAGKGFNPGEFTIIAAVTMCGKSALATTMARTMASRGISVGFISLEMTNQQVAGRLLTAEAGVSALVPEGASLTPEIQQKLKTAVDKMLYYDIIGDDILTKIDPICEKVTSWAKAGKVKIVFIDHIHLMDVEENNLKRNVEISIISRKLKLLAKTAGIPVVALAQLSRAVSARDDSRPRLSDLRESGTLEQDADKVIFIHRPSLNKAGASDIEKGDGILIAAKVRDGIVCDIPVFFDGKYCRFDACGENF